MSVLSSPATIERSGTGRVPNPDPGNLLGSMATRSPSEQARLLQEHGEVVADHMANHFARRTPHLAAKSGFARWQRAAGVAAALGAAATLVIAPVVLWIALVAVITAITLAHLVIAVAAGWRRPRTD